jgi:hypothetical protein
LEIPLALRHIGSIEGGTTSKPSRGTLFARVIARLAHLSMSS